MRDQILESFLQLACESAHGIVVETSSPDQLKQRLYMIRSAAKRRGETKYDLLSLRTSPKNPHGEIWIVKRKGQPNDQT